MFDSVLKVVGDFMFIVVVIFFDVCILGLLVMVVI